MNDYEVYVGLISFHQNFIFVPNLFVYFYNEWSPPLKSQTGLTFSVKEQLQPKGQIYVMHFLSILRRKDRSNKKSGYRFYVWAVVTSTIIMDKNRQVCLLK